MIAATYAALACGFLLGVPFGYWVRHTMGRPLLSRRRHKRRVVVGRSHRNPQQSDTELNELRRLAGLE